MPEKNKISELLHTFDDLTLVDIDVSAAELVSTNIEELFNSPENPMKELAINLYDALNMRLGEISNIYPRINSNQTALYRLNDVKECRDAVISGNYVLPAQNTIPYMEQGSIITLKNILTRAPDLIKALNKKKVVHQYDDEVIVNDAIAKRQGDCMLAVIQSGNDERVVGNASKTIIYLHKTLGSELTTEESEVKQAILSTFNVVKPIENDILRFLNVTLGPKKRL